MSKNLPIKERFISSANLSWLQHLISDPETSANVPNKSSRQVKSGHFVKVDPSPLPHPKLVAISPDVCRLIGLPPDFCRSSDDFMRYVSGDMSGMRAKEGDMGGFSSWCTPYALSIFGNEFYDNCPFKNGNGYGDGRAISVGEVLVQGEEGGEGEGGERRMELQLKGAGQTPFCRGGDGRSVLRSSVREFLAEEAMFHLGVSTTRALSLVVSSSEQVARAWFTPDDSRPKITVTDPRIAHYPLEQRKEIVKEVNGQPNAMIAEHTAIACRVAPSFIRVGHLELFSRRYRAALRQEREGASTSGSSSVVSHAFLELRLLAEHMLYREFDGPVPSPPSAQERGPVAPATQARLLAALRESSRRIALLTAEWMRVGFCQGNFNSDNCLVAGRTLDYGPFGFIERYERNWCMWSGGGDKYSFRRQHLAGERNFFSLACALAPLLDEAGQAEVRDVLIPSHLPAAEQAITEVYRMKLGLLRWSPEAAALFEDMDLFMQETEADYTLFWRQLSLLPGMFLPAISAPPAPPVATTTTSVSEAEEKEKEGAGSFTALYSDETLLQPLADGFYRPLTPAETSRWAALLRRWLELLHSQLKTSAAPTDTEMSGSAVSLQMQCVNPKYVPREWMLVEAYQAAAQGDIAPLERLQQLFAAPYDEHSSEDESMFYRKMPFDLLDTGGVTTMT